MKQSSSIILLSGLLVIASMGSAVAAADAEFSQAIANLKNSDPEVGGRARMELLRPENFQNLRAHQDEILKTITNVTSEEDALLLGAFDLPAGRRQMVLASPLTPAKVRARLGDQEARTQVLNRLTNAASLVEVRKAASDVAYIDDSESIKALAKRLESKRVFEDPHGNKISEVAVLLQAYGQAHPEYQLFGSLYPQHANVSPEQFRSAFHQDYLRQIEKFFNDRYQVGVHIDPPILLDTDKVGVHRAKIKN